MPQRIVVVGAGLAGGNAAATLRDEGFRGRVVLVGDEPEMPYGRPPLSKTYLRSEEDLTEWFVRPHGWYERNDVEVRTSASVELMDTHAHTVTLDSGETIDYDRLILCTGGRARRPNIRGVSLPGVHLLRTVADSDGVKNAVRPGAGCVVVGMGFIGSEVAASLRQLGMNVTAVMTESSPLESVLGREVGAVMAAIHSDHGVELLRNDRVVGFEGSERLEAAVTERGRRIACEMAVVGAGIVPEITSLADDIAEGNGVLVDEQCRTTAEGVYAAGDVANYLHPLFGRVRVEHYNNAEKMGAAAARSALGDSAPYAYIHTFWSDQYEDKLEYVGHAKRWERFVMRGSAEQRRFLGFYLEGGVVRAAMGLNRGGDPELEEDSELHGCLELIANQAVVAADVLADDTIPLRELAAARAR